MRMEEKFGFRTMAAPPPLRPEEDKEKVQILLQFSLNKTSFWHFFLLFGSFWYFLELPPFFQGSLGTRPGSFSFHIHKFLNIKQVSNYGGFGDFDVDDIWVH